MKVKAVRSFLVKAKPDGTRDIIELGEVREMEEETFNELRVHGLVEASDADDKAWKATLSDREAAKKKEK